MYLWTAGAFGLVGMAFSLVMRTELAQTGTIISAETYNSIFTMHGSVMIFLFLLPIGRSVHELFDAAANRRARYGLSPDQRAVLLDLPLRRRADHAELCGRGWDGLGRLDRPIRQSRWTRATTPSLPAPGMGYVVGRRHPCWARRRSSIGELLSHDLQDASAGMTMWRLPLFTLDDARHRSADPALDAGAGPPRWSWASSTATARAAPSSTRPPATAAALA